MKNLKNISVKVNNRNEFDKAFAFFKRATHRPAHPYWSDFPHMNRLSLSYDPIYVGYFTGTRYIGTGPCLGASETFIPFSEIKTLADTPSRLKAYNAVFGKA